jgi:ubiquinone/menaquinone biosynthesis C-methylase UbiE
MPTKIQEHRTIFRSIDGYLNHERQHIGRFFRQACPVEGRNVLEVGCNIGATAIVAADLGAKVCAVDVNEAAVAQARLNAELHGQKNIQFHYVPDSRSMPFAPANFDIVILNSVLEYVSPNQRAGVLDELDRVLKPGGQLVIHGTSNRLSPREAHSGKWLINYVPNYYQDSVNPFWILRKMRQYRNVLLDQPELFFASKRDEGWGKGRMATMRAAQRVLRPLRVSVGMVLPSFVLLLQKPSAGVQGHQAEKI